MFQTGVQYQMYHALALILVSLLHAQISGWLVQAAGWCFVAGIVLFSGSLYLLAMTGVTILGAITPIGGLVLPARLGLPRVRGHLIRRVGRERRELG